MCDEEGKSPGQYWPARLGSALSTVWVILTFIWLNGGINIHNWPTPIQCTPLVAISLCAVGLMRLRGKQDARALKNFTWVSLVLCLLAIFWPFAVLYLCGIGP